MTTLHVTPNGDLIEHLTDGTDCPCGATPAPVVRPDGSVGWVVTHHSLDGRENTERNPMTCLFCRLHTRSRLRWWFHNHLTRCRYVEGAGVDWSSRS